MTAGIGGPLTGRGAHLLIIDDPIKNSDQAYSPTVCDNHWDWWQTTASTRIEPGGCAIIIATRWGYVDLPGKLIKAAEGAAGRKGDAAAAAAPRSPGRRPAGPRSGRQAVARALAIDRLKVVSDAIERRALVAGDVPSSAEQEPQEPVARFVFRRPPVGRRLLPACSTFRPWRSIRRRGKKQEMIRRLCSWDCRGACTGSMRRSPSDRRRTWSPVCTVDMAVHACALTWPSSRTCSSRCWPRFDTASATTGGCRHSFTWSSSGSTQRTRVEQLGPHLLLGLRLRRTKAATDAGQQLRLFPRRDTTTARTRWSWRFA